MDVLVYPSTHESATAVTQSLSSLLTPYYLPQAITPAAFASPAYPWHTSCVLLVLLGPPEDHTAVRKYVELGGKILALGAGAKQSQGLCDSPFGLNLFLGGGGRDTNNIGHSSLSIDFLPQPRSLRPATVTHGTEQISVSRVSAACFDVDPCQTVILACYTSDDSPACILSLGRHVAVWSCAPLLSDKLLSATITALGLQLTTTEAAPSTSVLPQLLLAHKVQGLTVQHLFPQRSFQSHDEDSIQPHGLRDVTFSDEGDSFHFHFLPGLPSGSERTHPILGLLPQSPRSPDENVKDIIVPKEPLTAEQEHTYTPLFSPSVFFSALDEFRCQSHTVFTDTCTPWRMGDALLYGEVVTSTQSMLDKNPKFLRTLPSPILSLASKQLAGRGRGANAWLSPPGCMLISLGIRVPLKDSRSSTLPGRAIRASNLVFVQYLFALAVAEGCRALDPSGRWANKVKLKWPNDIYGEFPSQEEWKTSELKKLGGILVNLNFGNGMVDIVVGCGLNILNDPPVASLAQLEALGGGGQAPSQLRVERVAAAILVAFEAIWDSFLEGEERGFEPFLDRYTAIWVHTNQIVTVTTTTPHATVRIQGITTDHGLLRTVPVSAGYGSRYIDLQPDGNSFDMMRGLIKVKGA